MLLARQKATMLHEVTDPGLIGAKHWSCSWYVGAGDQKWGGRDSSGDRLTADAEFTRNLAQTLAFKVIGSADGLALFVGEHDRLLGRHMPNSLAMHCRYDNRLVATWQGFS